MTGCTFAFVTASAKGGRDLPLPGFSQESWEEAQTELLAWVNGWLQGDSSLPQLPSVAFGASCALAELAGVLPEDADYRAAPLCTGDPDDLVLQLADMPGEKVAKIKVGLYEAVRDGMVANLLLEAIPELHLRLDANRAWTPLKAQQFAKYVNPEYRGRIAFSKSHAKPAMTLVLLRVKPALPLPGMKACVKRISSSKPKRASRQWLSNLR